MQFCLSCIDILWQNHVVVKQICAETGSTQTIFLPETGLMREVVKKGEKCAYSGRKIVTKETQEGCHKVNCRKAAREGGLGHSC